MAVERGNFENGKGEIENKNVPDEQVGQLLMRNGIRHHDNHEQKKPQSCSGHESPNENGRLFIFRIQQIKVIEKIHKRKKSEDVVGQWMNFCGNSSGIPIPKSAADKCEEDEIGDGIFGDG